MKTYLRNFSKHVNENVQCYRPCYLVLNDVIHISIQLWQEFIILNRNLINYRVNTGLKQNAVKTRVSSNFNYLNVCYRHTDSTLNTTQNNYIIICGWTLPNKRQISFLPEGNWLISTYITLESKHQIVSSQN